jgi:hypothetical protein
MKGRRRLLVSVLGAVLFAGVLSGAAGHALGAGPGTSAGGSEAVTERANEQAWTQGRLQGSATTAFSKLMPSTEEINGWIADLTDMGVRKPGTEAGRQAAAYVAEKFRSFGLQNVHIEHRGTTQQPLWGDKEHGVDVAWTADSWALSVAGTPVSAYPMANTYNNGIGEFSTPRDGLNAEIVYVGEGNKSDFTEVDVRGKIVVSDVVFKTSPMDSIRNRAWYFHDPDDDYPVDPTQMVVSPYSPNNYPYNYWHAQEHGAAGFVGILSNYLDRNTYNPENYTFLGGAMKIPGLWVSKSAGAQIKELIAGERGAAHATLQLTGRLTQVLASSVVAYLPGKSSQTIMIHSHHDSSTPGAVQDASGTAEVLALARFYSQIPLEDRPMTLLFCTMDTHFLNYEAHDVFIANHLRGQDDILADVSLEHIALEVVEDSSGQAVLTGRVQSRGIFVSPAEALLSITKDEVIRHDLVRTAIIKAEGSAVVSDAHLFYQEGVPVISLISGPVYLYDNIDTLDKVAVDELRPTAEAFADIIWRLSRLSASDFHSPKK